MEATSLRFAAAARSLAHAARRRGLAVPAFRSPPRLVGVDRSIRRRPDGAATVSVRLRGRPWVAVLADMVEGVVVANALSGGAADQCRTAMWSAVEGGGLQAA
ncbi:MAG: hypothetical protein KDB10_07890 [Acidimicrobiales bacterium]|nr:hypothetical protein [Acidimicrobiales bacterium]MCB9373319.1 hypothetical protein [Microthrixaceae bacterium]